MKDQIEFFNQNEINILHKWSEKVYDKSNDKHIEAKNYLLDTVWKKTVYWSDELIRKLKGYEAFNWRMWSQRGWDTVGGQSVQVARFKPYTWARIYKTGDRNRDIFFTVGVSGKVRALVYKLDFYNEQDSQLSKAQKELCKQLIPTEVHWIGIPFDEIPKYNWESLLKITSTFIKENESLYDEIIESVWSNTVNVSKLRNRLIKREVPYDGLSDKPKRTFTFKGHDTDWVKKQLESSDTGLIGEDLVVDYEKNNLLKKGLNHLAGKVKKVQDGMGYDILSFFDDGSPKYIEVKTTIGNFDTSFPITINEIAFSELNPKSYFIYRVFNLQKQNKVGEFHEFKGSVRNNFILEEILFNAFRKSK